MKDITFITSNPSKAEYLSKYLDVPINHKKLELLEVQSMDLHKIVEQKVRLAFSIIKRPVIVEDVSLEFMSLHGLPGPFIKYFVENIPFETICKIIPPDLPRDAVARCVIGYYDGITIKLFEGSLNGTISEKPEGKNGYGWDKIFIPQGYSITRASMNELDDRKTYLKIKPFEKLRRFLNSE